MCSSRAATIWDISSLSGNVHASWNMHTHNSWNSQTTAETHRQQLKLTDNSWNKHTHNSCNAVFPTNQNTQIAVTLTLTLIYAHIHRYTNCHTFLHTIWKRWTDRGMDRQTHRHTHTHTHTPPATVGLSSPTRNVKHYLFMNLTANQNWTYQQ